MYFLSIDRKLNVIYFLNSVQRRGGGIGTEFKKYYFLNSVPIPPPLHRVQKVKFYYLLKIRFRTFLTKINHFCPFLTPPPHFWPFLSKIFFSRKCSFRPFKTIFERNLRFFHVFCPFSGKKTVYLPPGAS